MSATYSRSRRDPDKVRDVTTRVRDNCYGCGNPTIRHEQSGRPLCGFCAQGSDAKVSRSLRTEGDRMTEVGS